MPVRELDAIDDYIQFNGTFDVNSATKAVTLLAVMKLVGDVASDAGLFGVGNSATNGQVAGFYERGSGNLTWGTDDPAADDVSSIDFDDAGGALQNIWVILAMNKAEGSAVARFHIMPLSSGTWTHTPGALSIPARSGAVPAQAFINRFVGGGGFRGLRIATAAVFDTSLSDTSIASVGTALTTASIAALSPIALWDFNQASTGTSVSDLIGSNNQGAINGTTVITGDDPPGWTFGLGTPTFTPNYSRFPKFLLRK